MLYLVLRTNVLNLSVKKLPLKKTEEAFLDSIKYIFILCLLLCLLCIFAPDDKTESQSCFAAYASAYFSTIATVPENETVSFSLSSVPFLSYVWVNRKLALVSGTSFKFSVNDTSSLKISGDDSWA